MIESRKSLSLCSSLLAHGPNHPILFGRAPPVGGSGCCRTRFARSSDCHITNNLSDEYIQQIVGDATIRRLNPSAPSRKVFTASPREQRQPAPPHPQTIAGSCRATPIHRQEENPQKNKKKRVLFFIDFSADFPLDGGSACPAGSSDDLGVNDLFPTNQQSICQFPCVTRPNDR